MANGSPLSAEQRPFLRLPLDYRVCPFSDATSRFHTRTVTALTSCCRHFHSTAKSSVGKLPTMTLRVPPDHRADVRNSAAAKERGVGNPFLRSRSFSIAPPCAGL